MKNDTKGGEKESSFCQRFQVHIESLVTHLLPQIEKQQNYVHWLVSLKSTSTKAIVFTKADFNFYLRVRVNKLCGNRLAVQDLPHKRKIQLKSYGTEGLTSLSTSTAEHFIHYLLLLNLETILLNCFSIRINVQSQSKDKYSS